MDLIIGTRFISLDVQCRQILLYYVHQKSVLEFY